MIEGALAIGEGEESDVPMKSYGWTRCPAAHQLDLRLSKLLRFGGTRARASIDIYNALNSSAVLDLNEAYDAWQTPLEIIVARFYKFSVQFDF